MLIAALRGLIWLRREATWRERLLLAWIIVPVLFFTLWPVKGFQYLLPVARPWPSWPGRPWPGRSDPLLALGRAASPGGRRRRWLPRSALGALVAISVASLAVPAWARIQPSVSPTFLAGPAG